MSAYKDFQTRLNSETGLACLAFCARALGLKKVSLNSLKASSSYGITGNVDDIAAKAGMIALLCRRVRCHAADLPRLSRPNIVQLRGDVFVVLISFRRDGAARIFDPLTGERVLRISEMDALFDGLALELSPLKSFRKRPEKPLLSPFSFLVFNREMAGPFARVAFFALALQIYVVAGPMYARLVIDEAIPQADTTLLVVLAIAFGGLSIFNSSVSILRNLATQELATLMGWAMSRRVFHRLIRLPLPWFQAKTQGDILQKLSSIDAIKSIFTTSIVSVVLDAIVASLGLILLFSIAPSFGFLAVGVACLFVGMRVITVPITQRFQQRTMDANIKSNSVAMEIFRSIHTLKSMGGEDKREVAWQDAYIDNLQTNLEGQNVGSVISTINMGLTGLVTVLMYYLGATAVIRGDLTIGSMTAALAYQGQFTTRVSNIFMQYTQFRMLDAHVNRLVDVALTEPEEQEGEDRSNKGAIRGAIAADGIGFQYPTDDRLVLDRLTFNVKEGEHVAIVGRSGIGKSTLVKLLCGLYQPTQGVVLIDGKPISDWGLRRVRGAIGIVLQSDDLFAATIAENVSFFDDAADPEWIWDCLEVAGIREQVEQMPHGLASPVGEMGQTLSGGQRQRITLARALYKRPRILILDEATSHLDMETERKVLVALKKLNITVLLVAHRLETIAAADRIISLEPTSAT